MTCQILWPEGFKQELDAPLKSLTLRSDTWFLNCVWMGVHNPAPKKKWPQKKSDLAKIAQLTRKETQKFGT